ncbi:C40 family peptidase [Anaerococcus sp. Marseille-Q5996]|uniref:C40 family peptidase n=1 Tax=Anaerococcus sp. Marseille-Q5996 TaxID=2972769 RepID=UPI0021CACA47|nr:C40 family peptidase [Anaerococcus sp. Marseille-Q5996]
MNKKRIGAALSLVAAVTAGATAYASTINNLESDKNTKTMITPNYSENSNDYNFVKSDYTNDLKNTAIANETRTVQNTAKQEEKVAKIEENAKEILATTVINVLKDEKSNQEEKEVEYEVEYIEKTPVVEEQEVITYDDSELPAIEEETESQNEEVIMYDDSKLDENLEDVSSNELEETEVNNEVTNYLDNNKEEVETQLVEESPVVEATKFVNVEALYIRSSKSMDDNTNIVRTLVAGDKVNGIVDGEWLKIEEGYLNLKYLSNDYPQALVDSIQAKKAEEQKQAEEIKAQGAAKIQEQQVVEQTQEAYGTAFSGWVYNTPAVNVRDAAKSGNIIGTLENGSKVDGEIADGWVKTTYNGKTAFVSAYYLTTEDATKEEAQNTSEKQAEEQKVEEVQQVQAAAEEQKQNENQKIEEKAVEEVLDEEVVEETAQQAPVVNQNGQQAASIASQFAGSPYVWGASNPSVGFDCSGLVVYAYKQLGVNLPHSSQAQFNNGYAVGINNLQPGDLVFFSNHSGIDHVGIVTSSDGTFIHASTPKSGVKFDNVYSNYYQKVFAGARRIF